MCVFKFDLACEWDRSNRFVAEGKYWDLVFQTEKVDISKCDGN